MTSISQMKAGLIRRMQFNQKKANALAAPSAMSRFTVLLSTSGTRILGKNDKTGALLGATQLGVEAGKPVHFEWNASQRLAKHMNDASGRPLSLHEGEVASVTMFSKVDGKAQPPIEIARARGAKLVEVRRATVTPSQDAKGTLEVWFEATLKRSDANGQPVKAYDSRSGQNHVIEIAPQAKTELKFDRTFKQRQVGELREGEAFSLDYDANRLTRALARKADARGLKVGFNFLRADGSLLKRVFASIGSLGTGPLSTLRMARPTVKVPEGSARVETFFSDAADTTHDSAYSANYPFTVAPRG